MSIAAILLIWRTICEYMALHSVFSWFMKKRLHQIELFMKYPIEVQNEVFEKLISLGKNTEFGKDHNFSQTMAQTNFREQVPLQFYEDVKPYVERLQQGEQSLLWPTAIHWFAKSSGTTSDKSKFIPVTKESLEDCHMRGPKDVFAQFIKNFPETKILKGKTLTLGGSHRINKSSNNSFYGDLSAILIENVPFWADFIRTPSTEIALIEEFEEKIDKIIDTALDQNVTSFSGVPSWYLVLFKRALEKTGKNNVLEIWPNMEVFVHGGVNFEPYRKQYNKLFPSNQMHYMETYNASEGFFGIQDNQHSNDMLLMLDYGVYYEFIPMKDWDSDNPQGISLKDVEINENYAIVISTSAGLCRYIIGDTIKFTSKYPFKIKVTGRT